MTKWVFCTLQREKLHKWKGAKKQPEVSYLADLHRHVFHIKAWVQVYTDDREVEFIMMKHWLEKIVDGMGPVVGSCEMVADDIVKELGKRYGGRKYKVEVAEDAENGALIET